VQNKLPRINLANKSNGSAVEVKHGLTSHQTHYRSANQTTQSVGFVELTLSVLLGSQWQAGRQVTGMKHCLWN